MNTVVRLRPCVTTTHLHSRLLSIKRFYPRLTAVNHRFKATKPPSEEEIDLDAPIKFSTSRAATWKPRDTYGGHQGKEEKNPWLEPVVVSLSLTVFLLYFCLFREESDVDTQLTKSLYEHIDGLEERQLELSLKHNLETGQDTQAILKRLEEIQIAKEKAGS